MIVDVPMGHAAFPKEVRRPPCSMAETAYTEILRWTVMHEGGHFSALGPGRIRNQLGFTQNVTVARQRHSSRLRSP
jgi:hypothetical protein